MGNNTIMKFILCIVALAVMVSVEARPDTFPIKFEGGDNTPDFFTAKLKSVQGAIYDTLRAGQDLQTMENSLRKIVDSSAHFYRAESATEYAVDPTIYKNGWTVEDAGEGENELGA